MADIFGPLWDPTQRIFVPFLVGGIAIALIAAMVSGRNTSALFSPSLFSRSLWWHPSARMDYRLWLLKRIGRVVGLLGLPLGAFAIAAAVLRALNSGLGATSPLQNAEIPGWIATVCFSAVLFICWDASRFALHWAAHRVPWLWSLHQVHHSAEVLTPMTLYRGHPIEALLFNLRGVLVTGSLTGVFFWLFGSRAVAWQILGVDALGFTFNALGGNLRHSPVWISYGPRLERWLISPVMHQLHHTPACCHTNLGTWLAVWDRLAGTLEPAGERRELTFGLPDDVLNHRPRSVVSSLLDPLGLRPRHAAAAIAIAAATLIAVMFGTAGSAQAQVVTKLPAAVTPVKAKTPAKAKRRAYRPRLARIAKGTKRLRRITVFGRRKKRRAMPGSAHEIGPKQLQRFEHNDPHRAIAEAPGVYFREEDGYGLRPNIGMRGVSAERSAKIALMEDGIPIAPAPYAAPAAYYFPLVTRMERIEVLKGPAAIRHGPNTVAGALNLSSARPPDHLSLFADLAGGNTFYRKAHLRYGDRAGSWSWLIEGVHLGSDGFKELSYGGKDNTWTGFSKYDGSISLRYRAPAGARRHTLLLRIGHSRETSNETYTGLSRDDFEKTPQKRYTATHLDEMTWQHNSVRLIDDIALTSSFNLRTTLYVNDFARDWRKLNGFTGDRSLADVVKAPTSGANAIYYNVLSGKSDTVTESERVVIGTNARTFRAMGLQLALDGTGKAFGVEHELELGVRIHRDEVDRKQLEDSYAMRSNELAERKDRPMTLSAMAYATAFAGWVQDSIKVGHLTVTAGTRLELVQTDWQDRLDGKNDADGSYNAVIPGLGVLYKLSKPLALLAGVNRGFVPVAPGQQGNATPESSWNGELGARWTARRLRGDVVGFWSEYGNLKGTCTFSAGCNPAAVGTEFNGGAVRTMGLEASVETLFKPAKGLRVPLRLSYTFTRSRFQTAFLSTNPQWGRIEIGDEQPYVPPHQLSVQAGIGTRRWELNAAYRFTAAMRDSAGQGDDGLMTDAAHVIDASGSFAIKRWLKLYVTVNNVLDAVYVTSHRPFGVRPGMTRLVIGGIKLDWSPRARIPGPKKHQGKPTAKAVE